MMAVILGVNIIYFYTFTKLYAEKSRFIPHDKTLDSIVNASEDKGVFAGFLLAVAGVLISIVAFAAWKHSGFG